MEKILSFFNDVRLKKFKTRNGGSIYHDKNKILSDDRFNLVKIFIEENYYVNGMGIKSIIKKYNLSISYSVLRFYLINFFNIKIRDNKEVTDYLRNSRRDKAIYEKNNNIGFFDKILQDNIKIKNSIIRGIQGYYFNVSLNKYVWLRSSWEYIFAKWLDRNNYKWDVEIKTFDISNNKKYRPDFFILDENDNILKIIEVKGYWKNKIYKFIELKNLLNKSGIEFILVEEIKSYSFDGFKNDLNEWKKCRILDIKNKY